MNPQFPLYIPTKGRAAYRLTIKALEAMKTPFRIIIEEQEYKEYAAVVEPKKILILPKRYQDEYETCDKLGATKSKGPGPARNFAWDHSIEQGAAWHWVMDDNINGFYRYNQNRKIYFGDGTLFRIMEDFCLRYENVAMAGPNYATFVPRKRKFPPFILNTRIYSCNLIRNDVPYRWRGRYNEDTDISLRMLKDRWVTVQFDTFLQNKAKTQIVPGGNTKEFYAKEGTMPKSQMLVDLHPDVARITWRFGRWHHHVTYGPFKGNKLILRKGIAIPDGPYNYGMEIVKIR